MKKLLFILITVLIFSSATFVLTACGGRQNVNDDKKEILLDENDVFLEYGKEASIPNASVYDKNGNAIEFDVVCKKITSPSGEEIDFAGGNFIPSEIGEYTFLMSSESAKNEVEIKIQCNDTIDPELTMDVPVEFVIKETFDAVSFCDLEFPSFKASDLAGIRDSETKVFFGGDKREVLLNSNGTFTIEEEGPLYFYVKVTDNNGRSSTIEGQSYATLPEQFEGYCLSSFNRQSYETKASEGWVAAATSRIVTVLDNDTDGENNTYEGVLKVETAGNADQNNHPSYLKITLGRSVKRDDIDGLTITYRIVNGGVDSVNTRYDSVWYAQNGYWEPGHYNLPLSIGENYRTISIENKKLLDQLTAFDGYIKEIRLATFGKGDTMAIYIADISYIPHDPTNLRLSVANYSTNGKGIYLSEPFGIREVGSYEDWATVSMDGTVLFNGQEIDARLQVTQHELNDYVVYLTNMTENLNATQFDIVTIKMGYGLNLGGETVNTKRDYSFVYNGADLWKEVLADEFVSITVTGGTSNKKYCASGEKVTLTVDESEIPVGKEFSNWTLNGQALVGNEFTVTENANFVANYSDIIYTVEITGGTANKATAIYGETVTFTVDEGIVPEGKMFYYWTVNGSKIDGMSVVVTEDITVEANYGEIVSFTVSTVGCTASEESAVYGTIITLSGSSKTDCTLKYIVNGKLIEGNSFTLNEDTNVEAINVYSTALTFAEQSSINKDNGLKKGLYVVENLGLKAKGSLSNWAELNGNGTVLYNGDELTEKINVTQSELGANTLYITNSTENLNAIEGDILIIKAGYDIVIGDIHYITDKDYNFFFPGKGPDNTTRFWRCFDEIKTLELSFNKDECNSKMLCVTTNYDIQRNIGMTLEGYINESTYVTVKGAPYDVGAGIGSGIDMQMRGIAGEFNKFNLVDNTGTFTVGQTVCFKKGFAIYNDTSKYLLVTDKDYTYTYYGSMGWVGDVQDLTLDVSDKATSNATTLYLTINAPTTDAWANTPLHTGNAIRTDKVKINGTYENGDLFQHDFKETMVVHGIGTALNVGETIVFEAGFTVAVTANGVRTAFVLSEDVTFTYNGGNSWVKE